MTEPPTIQGVSCTVPVPYSLVPVLFILPPLTSPVVSEDTSAEIPTVGPFCLGVLWVPLSRFTYYVSGTLSRPIHNVATGGRDVLSGDLHDASILCVG